MTSIICWRNKEDFDSIWAVSDSRVSSGSNVMIDNCPKLFPITAYTFESSDCLKTHPKVLFRFGFGFAGSTLIGTNVKEMLSSFLSNLSEINYYDVPDYPTDKKMPSLMDVAELTKKIGDIYIKSLGLLFPKNTRCEFVIFGYCKSEGRYLSIKLSNSPESPAEIKIEEVDISDNSYLILGDRKDYIENKIEKIRLKFESDTINWWRSPIIVLTSLLKDKSVNSIGGYLQLCIATRLDARTLFLSTSEPFDARFVGFKLFKDIITLGGYSINVSGGVGMTIPSEDGWN